MIGQDKLTAKLREMTDANNPQPAADVIKFAQDNGYPMPQETIDRLNNVYEPTRLKYGKIPQGVVVNQPAPPPPDPNGRHSTAEDAWFGLRHGALAHFDDRLDALGGAAGDYLGGKIEDALGYHRPHPSFSDSYDINLDRARGEVADHQNDGSGLAFGLGEVGGSLLAPTRGVGLARDAGLGMRAVDAGVRGAQIGGETALGDTGDLTNVPDAVGNVVKGTVAGGVTGAAVAPVIHGIGSAAGAAYRMIPRAGEDTSGLAVLHAGAPQDADAMEAKLAQYKAAGVPARLVDLVDAKGQRLIGIAANKTDAANIVSQHADQVYDNFPERVVTQADRLGPPETRGGAAPEVDTLYRGGRPASEVNHPGGIYTTPDRDAAQDYADILNEGGEYEGQVHKYYGRLKNPADEETVFETAKQLGMRPERQDTIDAFDPEFNDPKDIENLVATLKAKGHDGARMPGQGFGGEDVDTHLFFNKDDLSQSPPRAAPITARQASRALSGDITDLGPRYDAVRNNPVTVDGAMAGVFRTAEGRSALRVVARQLGPEDSAKLGDLIKGLQSTGTKASDSEPPAGLMVMGKRFDDLPPKLQDIIRADYSAKAGSAGGSAPTMTVDIADKTARALNKAAQKSGNPGALTDMANTIRDAARAQHPEYDAALNDHATLAGLRDAADGTGRYQGTDFLKTPADDFQHNFGAAPNTNASVVDANGEPLTMPSAQDLMRARAQQRVQDIAGNGNRGALAVADRLGRDGTNQAARTDALLGPGAGADLRQGMSTEAERYRNTQAIDPRLGSKTSRMQQGNDDLDDLATLLSGGAAAAHAATGSPYGVANLARKVSTWFGKVGISGVDANRLVRDTLSEDPQKIQSSIEFMRQRGMDPSIGRRIVRTIINSKNAGNAAAQAAGSGVANSAPPPAPNSVRAVMGAQ
jgi:hypothetical protein